MKTFAFANSMEKVLKESSGGAFSAIVDAVISMTRRKKIIIYGAAFTDDFVVRHIRVENGEVSRLYGSKYVWSDFGESLSEVRDDLEVGYIVIFSGCPCQVSSLKTYLKNRHINMDNLICIDIICHGAPKPEYWNDFVKWLEKRHRSKLVEFSFRDKVCGWHGYPQYARFQNNSECKNDFEIRTYIDLFFLYYIMREACYSCKFANLDREGDLTIGDFWGIETLISKFPIGKGVSEILCNTEKGEKIINYILNNSESNNYSIIEYKKQDFISFQHNLNKPISRPNDYIAFKKDYEKHGFDYVIKKYADRNLKRFTKQKIKSILQNNGLLK